MRIFQEEEITPAAAPRHARLFELIRQDNLAHDSASEFLTKTRALSAQERFRDMAAGSLKRPRVQTLASEPCRDDKLFGTVRPA